MEPVAEHTIVKWHNCNREIGELLRRVSRPNPDWNSGQPSWALVVIDGHSKKAIWLPIQYCPICGTRLVIEETGG